MSGSEAVTTGIRVRVEAEYSEVHSRPQLNQWFFLYTIIISNESDRVVRLLNRHWIITDATQQVQEVRGPGVVGQQPVLRPGESFEYTFIPAQAGTFIYHCHVQPDVHVLMAGS